MNKIIVVVMAFGLLAAGCSGTQNTSQQIDNTTSTQNEQISPGKYSNLKYKLSFEYPADWKVITKEYDQTMEDKKVYKALNVVVGPNPLDDEPNLSVSFGVFPVNPSIETFGKCIDRLKDTLIISGVSATKCGNSTEIGGMTGMGVSFQYSNLFYDVGGSLYTGSNMEVIDKVISSIKLH